MVDMSGGEPPDPGQGPPVVVGGRHEGAPDAGAPPKHQVTATPLVTPATARPMPADASHRSDGSAPSSTAGPGSVWAGDAAAVLRSSPKLTEEQARASRVVAGVWNPLLQKRLVTTMVKDWATLTDRTWTDGERELYNVAMEPAEVMRDGSTRPMTVPEERALLAYMRGELELPHPPNFIKATLSPMHRAMLEDIHEAHFNVTLTANLPPFVMLKRTANIPHVELFRSLYTANTDGAIGRDMMRCLQRDVKRFIYDGAHTLRFVFYSGRVTAHWARQSLRFQKAVITLHNTSRSSGAVASGAYTAAHMEQMYALHVCGCGALGLAALFKALAHVPGAEVLDVEFPRTTKTEIYDNRYHIVRFAQESCPSALDEVTRVCIQGLTLVLHHYQTNLRLPCSRCYSPRHGTARCNATPGALHALQAKGSRIVNGVIPTFSPQARDSYKVQDVAELMALLAAHEAALVPHAEVALDRVDSTSAVASEATPLRSVAAGTAVSPAVTTGVSTEVTEAAGDGYVVQLSARAKCAARKSNSTAAPVQQARLRSIPNHTIASPVAVAQEATDVRTPSVAPKARKKGSKQSGFAAFQRAEALGRYGVLAEDDSDGEDSTDAVTTSGAADVEMIHHNSHASITCPEVVDAVDIEMGGAPASASPSEQTLPMLPVPLVSEPPAAPTVPVASCGKTATAMVQTTLARYVNGAGLTTDAGHPTQPERSDDDIVPATPTSQEGFTMGKPHTGSAEGDSDLPIQAAHWLASFAGREIAVAANGQCAFLALYATISNHSSATLTNTAANMTQAAEVKRGVYSLMMVNLRHDVELGVVDPIAEYRRLYPTQPLHESVVAATAALFAHYAQERRRSTETQVPQSFWAGPHELRAMAQYLRQPLVVLTVDTNGDAHLQRYMYKELRLRNGDDHETGYYEALTDRQAREYLFECWSLHVLPYFLILRQHERHFYGVSHGDIFVKWRVEGDSQYAAMVSDSFSWKSTINLLSPSDEVELASLNQLANVDTVNAVLLKRMSLRQRLDVVHARLGLPTLDSDGYDNEAELDHLIAQEEGLLQEAYGMDEFARGSQEAGGLSDAEIEVPQRYPRLARGPITEDAYFRILRAAEIENIPAEDRPHYSLLKQANREAFSRWGALHRTQFNVPATRRRSSSHSISEWLLKNPAVLRHLFAFLPFPEVEAKQWPIADLMTWGSQEVFREQTEAISRIARDTSTKDHIRSYCSSWLDAVTQGPDATKVNLAADDGRWARLRRTIGPECSRDNDTDLDLVGWRLLHVLPYVVGTWATTPMGCTPNGSRAVWYHEFAFVRDLCHGILEHGDWSAAQNAPCGQTWEDQQAEDDADLPAALRY